MASSIDAQTLRSMPSSRLKELLQSHNIPIEDCIEKEDLVKRAMIYMFRTPPPATTPSNTTYTSSTFAKSPPPSSSSSSSSSYFNTSPSPFSSPSSASSSSSPNRKSEAPQLDIPEEFLCPISSCIMFDPVLTENGYAYSRKQITQWLNMHSTEPLTNERIVHKVLVPDRMRLQRMRSWAEQHEAKLLEMEELPVAEDDHLFITMEVFNEEDIKKHVSENKLELLWFDDCDARVHHYFSWMTLKDISQKLLSKYNRTGDAKIFRLTKKTNGTIRPIPYRSTEINQPLLTLKQEKKLSQQIYIMFTSTIPPSLQHKNNLLFFKLFDPVKNRLFEYIGHGLFDDEDSLENAFHHALTLAGEILTMNVNYLLHEEEEISSTGLVTIMSTTDSEGRDGLNKKIGDLALSSGDIIILEIQRHPSINSFWKTRVADPMWGSRRNPTVPMNDD